MEVKWPPATQLRTLGDVWPELVDDLRCDKCEHDLRSHVEFEGEMRLSNRERLALWESMGRHEVVEVHGIVCPAPGCLCINSRSWVARRLEEHKAGQEAEREEAARRREAEIRRIRLRNNREQHQRAYEHETGAEPLRARPRSRDRA